MLLLGHLMEPNVHHSALQCVSHHVLSIHKNLIPNLNSFI